MTTKRKISGAINIPLDLTVEILKKLPVKSLVRFQCVSKQWKTIIRDFIIKTSIVTRSLTQPSRDDPHFIFGRILPFSNEPTLVFSYTYPHHQFANEETLLYKEEIFGKGSYRIEFQYVRGLICFWCSCYGKFIIHNPTTRGYVSLPITDLTSPLCGWFYLFGYDPSTNKYKVLCLTIGNKSHQIFTLGDPEKQWRVIQCDIGRHIPFGHVVYINGAIYYKAKASRRNQRDVLVSFDVRSEKFNYVQAPEQIPAYGGNSILVNYQGKLGCICSNNLKEEDADLWVMENVEKQEWSKITFSDMLKDLPISCIRYAGVTRHCGEIVIVREKYSCKFGSDVYYYDPKRNSRRRVEIETTSVERRRPSDYVTLWAITDHVENIMYLS